MQQSLKDSYWKFGDIYHELEKVPEELEDQKLSPLFSKIKANLEAVVDHIEQIINFDLDAQSTDQNVQASADLVQQNLYQAKISFNEFRKTVTDSISENDESAINDLREIYSDLGEVYLEKMADHHFSFSRLNTPEVKDHLIQSVEDFRNDRIEILESFLNPSTHEDAALHYLRRSNYMKRINAGFPVLLKLAENLGILPSDEVLRHEFKVFFPEIKLADFDKALKSPKDFAALVLDATETLREDSKKDLASAARILLTMQAKLLEQEDAYDIKMHITEKMLSFIDKRKDKAMYVDINADAQNHIAEKEIFSGHHNVIYVPNPQPPILDETMDFFKEVETKAAVELLRKAREDIIEDAKDTRILEEFCEKYKLLSIKLNFSPEELKELALADDNEKLRNLLETIYQTTMNDSSIPFKPAAIVHNALAKAFAQRVQLIEMPEHLLKLSQSYDPSHMDPAFADLNLQKSVDFADFLYKPKSGDKL